MTWGDGQALWAFWSAPNPSLRFHLHIIFVIIFNCSENRLFINVMCQILVPPTCQLVVQTLLNFPELSAHPGFSRSLSSWCTPWENYLRLWYLAALSQTLIVCMTQSALSVLCNHKTDPLVETSTGHAKPLVSNFPKTALLRKVKIFTQDLQIMQPLPPKEVAES